MISVSAEVVTAVTAVVGVAAVVPAPDVVADAVTAAPFLICAVNWSAAAKRDEIDLVNVMVGVVGPLENVQVITSPLAGVSANDAPAPLGSTVVEPAVLFVQAMLLVYCARTEDEPAAIASVRV